MSLYNIALGNSLTFLYMQNISNCIYFNIIYNVYNNITSTYWRLVLVILFHAILSGVIQIDLDL